MKTIHFKCYKVASRLQLDTFSSLLGISRAPHWEDFLVLKGDSLHTVLKYKTSGKSAYIFEYGCITLVNFNEEETGIFIAYLETLSGPIDSELFSHVNESHTFHISRDGQCRMWKGAPVSIHCNDNTIQAAAIVLAKSTALYKVELDTERLLDESEILLEQLQQGHLRTGKRRFTFIFASMLRFEYESANNIRIFDRSHAIDRSSASRKAYDSLAMHYELMERFDTIKSKIGDLREITQAYGTYHFNQTEKRLSVFEIILLTLFPLPSLIRHLLALLG